MVVAEFVVERPVGGLSHVDALGDRILEEGLCPPSAGADATGQIAIHVLGIHNGDLYGEAAAFHPNQCGVDQFGGIARIVRFVKDYAAHLGIILDNHVGVALFLGHIIGCEISGSYTVTAGIQLARCRGQHTGIQAVLTFHNTGRCREGLQRLAAVFRIVDIPLMQFGHNLIPNDTRGILFEIAEGLVHFVAEPNTAHVIGRISQEPAVKVVTGCTGLTGHVHRIAEGNHLTGTLIHNVLHHHGHKGCILLAHNDGGFFFVFQDQIALVVIHGKERTGLVIHTVVLEDAVCRRDLFHRQTKIHLTESQRCQQLIRIHRSVRCGVGIDEAAHSQLVLNEIEGFINGQFLQNTNCHGIF